MIKKKLVRKKYDTLVEPNTNPWKDERGRPPLYNAKYHCKLVYRLALLNLSETEMCVAMDLSVDVFTDWKRYHVEFKDALNAGRDQADAKVARALFRRAVGWGCLEEEVITRKLKDKDGNEYIETKKVPRRKKYPPDVAAIQMWLKNRHPGKWKVNDQLERAPTNVLVNVDLSGLSLEDLRTAQRIGVATNSGGLITQ